MSVFWIVLAGLCVLFAVGFGAGKARAYAVCNGSVSDLHSRPGYHGAYVALSIFLPCLFALLAWAIVSPSILESYVLSESAAVTAGMSAPEVQAFARDARALAFGGIVGRPELVKDAAELYRSYSAVSDTLILVVAGLLAAAGFFLSYRKIQVDTRTRHTVERVIRITLIACSAIAILTTIGIVMSLIFESLRFFQKIPLLDFLFGIEWSPQTALRADQVGGSGTFGMIPLFVGTLLITLIAMLVAAPVGLLAAIYLSDYATNRVRAIAKPVLEILAGIPTVVYGFFAALTVAPMFRGFGESVGLTVSSESALAAGVVMGIMIIPFVSSLSDDVINAVPQSLRDGSAGLGATKSETIMRVVLPAALPGIVSALLLAVSRAIGETMIVVMAAGLAANLTINPLEAVTTVTVQIVTLLVGDQEFDSAKTLAAFALGLVLFCVTLALNVIALRVVQKYREQYD
ncbi:phosphate ABC transporter permease subunit PstC [Coralliovum pocilloporae]|uniref:phosphate ABC transporter permease subunit PstC n=1 Tax=Coralliovum pocilloporae TaxID=3066369 RepID=UPI003307C2D6